VTFGEYYDPTSLVSFSSDIKQMQTLRSEVCCIPRKFNGAGLIQIMSKPEMRTKQIRSPNIADCIMMSLAITDRAATITRKQPTRVAIV